MTDLASVGFVVDGHTFTKSIEDAEKLVRDLNEKIRTARIYRNLPFANGRLTLDDVDQILRGSGLLDRADNGAVMVVIETVWRRICQDNSTEMFCPHCEGVPRDEHSASVKDTWEIDIYVLIRYLGWLIGGSNLQDWRNVRECCEYLFHRLDHTLVACR